MNIRWKKQEALRRSIRRMRAGIQPVCGLFFCLFLFVLLVVLMELFRYHTSVLYLEDALAASGLAAAVVDLEEYGISHTIRIRDGEESYRKYVQALQDNLCLDEHWNSGKEQLIAGNVRMERFIIYTVNEQECYSRERDGAGHWHLRQAPKEGMYAPNGQAVEETAIYGEVSFEVQGMWGIRLRAQKGILVDVCGEERKRGKE